MSISRPGQAGEHRPYRAAVLRLAATTATRDNYGL
jgi:hypothetical protein